MWALPSRLAIQHLLCTPTLQVSAGWEQGADVGPVISPQAKQRIERLIESGVKQVGAERLR